MATIHDLNESILGMEDSKAFELIKAIRFDRRIIKKTTMRKSSSKKPAKTIDIKSMVSSMGDEARMKLLAELSGE